MSNHKNTTIKQLFYNKQLIVNYVKVNLYCTTLEKNTNLLHKYLKKNDCKPIIKLPIYWTTILK